MFGNNQFNGFQGQQGAGIDINEAVRRLAELRNNGAKPNALLGQALQANPNLQGVQQQLTNMSQGKNPKDFILQLAKQGGATQETLQTILQMLG